MPVNEFIGSFGQIMELQIAKYKEQLQKKDVIIRAQKEYIKTLEKYVNSDYLDLPGFCELQNKIEEAKK